MHFGLNFREDKPFLDLNFKEERNPWRRILKDSICFDVEQFVEIQIG